jgi:hypothetical protein
MRYVSERGQRGLASDMCNIVTWKLTFHHVNIHNQHLDATVSGDSVVIIETMPGRAARWHPAPHMSILNGASSQTVVSSHFVSNISHGGSHAGTEVDRLALLQGYL